MLEDFAEVAAMSVHRRILKENANMSAYNIIHEKRVGILTCIERWKCGERDREEGQGVLQLVEDLAEHVKKRNPVLGPEKFHQQHGKQHLQPYKRRRQIYLKYVYKLKVVSITHKISPLSWQPYSFNKHTNTMAKLYRIIWGEDCIKTNISAIDDKIGSLDIVKNPLLHWYLSILVSSIPKCCCS